MALRAEARQAASRARKRAQGPEPSAATPRQSSEVAGQVEGVVELALRRPAPVLADGAGRGAQVRFRLGRIRARPHA